ncbi:MAG: hypothetical protein P8Y18_08675 [Candidatus Bathyarchaeota archaeon]
MNNRAVIKRIRKIEDIFVPQPREDLVLVPKMNRMESMGIENFMFTPVSKKRAQKKRNMSFCIKRMNRFL